MSGKKNGYKPSKYDGSTYDDKDYADNFSLDEVELILIALKPNSSEKLKDLKGNTKTNYDKLLAHVRTHYNEKTYPQFYNLIKKHYTNSSYIPGTLGGYIAGCLVSNSIEGVSKTCNPGCANSIQPPKKEAKQCDVNSINAIYSGDAYVFTTIHGSNTSRDAVIYLNAQNLSNFNGFSQAEKNALASKGIERVKLANVDTYDQLDDWKALADVKVRNVAPVAQNNVIPGSAQNNAAAGLVGAAGLGGLGAAAASSGNGGLSNTINNLMGTSTSTSSGGLSFGWWIFIILAVLIVIIVGFALYSKNKKTTTTTQQTVTNGTGLYDSFSSYTM